MSLASRILSLLLLGVVFCLPNPSEQSPVVPILCEASGSEEAVLDAASVLDYASLERPASVRVAAPEVLSLHRLPLSRLAKEGGLLSADRAVGGWLPAIRCSHLFSFFADPSPEGLRLRLCLLRI